MVSHLYARTDNRVKIFAVFTSRFARLYNPSVPNLTEIIDKFKTRLETMSRIRVISAVVLAAIAGVIAYSNVNDQVSPGIPDSLPVFASKPVKTMRPFRSAEDLKDFFKKLAEKQRREAEQRASGNGSPVRTLPPCPQRTSLR